MPRLLPLLRRQAGGVRFLLRADAREPLRGILARWAELEAAPRGRPQLRYDLLLRPRRLRLVRDGRSCFSTRSLPHLRVRLEQDLYAQVSARSPASPLHAAALEWEGGGLLLVGASGAGKTSLARALQERGAGYLGEEHAFVSEDGGLSGLPRAQQLDAPPPAGSTTGGLYRAPLRVCHRVPRVDLLVFLERPRGGEPPRRLSAAEAAARLVAGLHRPPRPEDLARLSALAAQTPAVLLARAGVAAAAEAVLAARRNATT